VQGCDLRERPFVQRRARLRALLGRARSNLLRFRESFTDAEALLAELRSPRLPCVMIAPVKLCFMSRAPPVGASLVLVAVHGRTNARGACKI
jgi:hypothetical protein